MANGMASLMVGASGLKTSQTALNTTAHNLSNVNTTGYTRQQITFADSTYVNVFGTGNSTGKCGLGVDVDAISRIRNDFIDKSYRTENARLGYYESQYKAVEEVEDLFGEMQGVTYQTQITNLYNAINELTKNPTSTIARSSLIQNATAVHGIYRHTAQVQNLTADYASISVLIVLYHFFIRLILILPNSLPRR